MRSQKSMSLNQESFKNDISPDVENSIVQRSEFNDEEGPMSLTIDTRKQFFDENADFAEQEQIAEAVTENRNTIDRVTQQMTE